MDNQRINQFLEKNPKHADALKMHSGKQMKNKLNNIYDSTKEDEAILEQDLRFDKGAKGMVSPDDTQIDKRNYYMAKIDSASIKGISNQVKPDQTYSDLSVESHIGNNIHDKVRPLKDNKDVHLHVEYAKEFHKEPGDAHDLVNDNKTQKLINHLDKSSQMSSAVKQLGHNRNRAVNSDKKANKSINKNNTKQSSHKQIIKHASHKITQHNGPSLV